MMRALLVAVVVVVSAPFVLLGQSRLEEHPARITASPQQLPPEAFIDKIVDMANVGPKDYVIGPAWRAG